MPGRRVCPMRKDQSWVAIERSSGDGQRARVGPGSRAHFLLQGHDREQADDPKGDDARFEES